MYLLDTTALLAHLRNDAGANLVASILLNESSYVAAPTWLELRMILKDEACAAEVMHVYREALTGTVDITEPIATVAFELGPDLPLIDSLIAAAARIKGFTLIHRDPNFSSIPKSLLRQQMLP